MTPRSPLARLALAAWANVRPDQLPDDKAWIEHPNDANRQAWDRVVLALFEAYRKGARPATADAPGVKP